MSADAGSKPLAYAVADWLKRSAASSADADKAQNAAKLVAEAFGVDPASEQDRAKYGQSSPGLQAIFDVFLKTQQRMGGAAAGTSSDAAAGEAQQREPSADDVAKAEQLKNDGNKYMSSKDYGAALDAYTKAIELNPRTPVFYSNRAAAYSQVGQHDEAVADARKAIEIDSKFGKAYSRLGHALFASGQYSEAVSAYERGLEVDPSNKLMKAGLDASKSKANESSVTSRPGEGAQPSNAGAAAGGFPGAGGGMPDLSSLMNNPMLGQMAQQMYVQIPTTATLTLTGCRMAAWNS